MTPDPSVALRASPRTYLVLSQTSLRTVGRGLSAALSLRSFSRAGLTPPESLCEFVSAGDASFAEATEPRGTPALQNFPSLQQSKMTSRLSTRLRIGYGGQAHDSKTLTAVPTSSRCRSLSPAARGAEGAPFRRCEQSPLCGDQWAVPESLPPPERQSGSRPGRGRAGD